MKRFSMPNKIKFFCPNCRGYQQLESHVGKPDQLAKHNDPHHKSYYRCHYCEKPLLNEKGDFCFNLIHVTKVFRDGLWSVGGTLYNANSSCDY